MERQFTASAYIVDERGVLLIFHRKLQKWLPPGGHVDPGETPPEAARREAFEEAGVQIELIQQENIWIDRWNAKSFERPFLCLLEEIPAHGSVPAHQHMDFVYVAKPVNSESTPNYQEIEDMRWFTLEEVEALESDIDIFDETKKVIQTILAVFSRPLYASTDLCC